MVLGNRGFAGVAAAQRGSTRSPAEQLETADPLDVWIVTRYRAANLLSDSAVTTGSLASNNGPLPRIESVRGGRDMDTLMAVQMDANKGPPMMPVSSRARLVTTNGIAVPVTVRVIQRRPFRAPRIPDADPLTERQWRYGWAYLVVLPHDDKRPTARYRGWLLLPVTPTSPI